MLKNMKRIAVFMLAAFFLSGCQPTPDAPIVAQRGDIMDALMKMPDDPATPSTADDKGAIELEYEVVGHWKETFPNAMGNCTVEVDADIIAPKTEAVAAVQVIPHAFTEADAIKYRDILFPGQQANSRPTTSAEDFERDILALQRKISEMENGNMPEDEPRDPAIVIAEYRAEIEKLKELYNEAKAMEEQDEPADLFRATSSYMQQATLYGKNEEGRDYVLTLVNMSGFYQFRYEAVDWGSLSGIRDEEERAKAEEVLEYERIVANAESLLEKLGIQDHYLSYAEPYKRRDPEENSRYVYELVFARTYGCIPCGIVTALTEPLSTEDPIDEYARPIFFENIVVYADNNGVLCLSWRQPYDVEKVVTRNISMLDQEEMKEALKRQLSLTAGRLVPIEDGATVYVTEIKQNGMYVRIKDDALRYVVVPVWDAMAYELLADGRDLNTLEGVDRLSYVAIDAVDGVAVSREVQ